MYVWKGNRKRDPKTRPSNPLQLEVGKGGGVNTGDRGVRHAGSRRKTRSEVFMTLREKESTQFLVSGSSIDHE